MVHVTFDDAKDDKIAEESNGQHQQKNDDAEQHFLNINTVLLSLIDFIRPETFIAQDELEQYLLLKEKFIHKEKTKKNKEKASKNPSEQIETASAQSIRTTSAIYQFLGHHDKAKKPVQPPASKQQQRETLSHVELVEKLHSRMPHRQQHADNNTLKEPKRKRTKEIKSQERKKQKTTEWQKSQSASLSTTSAEDPSPNQALPQASKLTFGRFEFDSDENKKNKKHKVKMTKNPKTKKQLIDVLKKVESEQSEMEKLRAEDPEKADELKKSQKWKNAISKAKGEKLRDNVTLIKKSIKKTNKVETTFS